jgi:hypothetical protein
MHAVRHWHAIEVASHKAKIVGPFVARLVEGIPRWTRLYSFGVRIVS